MKNKQNSVLTELEGFIQKAVSLVGLEKYRDALVLIDKVIEINPEDHFAHEIKVQILMRLNIDFTDCFRKLSKFNNDATPAYHKKVDLLLEDEEYSNALWYCEYSKRNNTNGYNLNEDTVKEGIHELLIGEFESKGIFGHEYTFYNTKHILFIILSSESIKIVYPDRDIIFDRRGSTVIKRKNNMAIKELKNSFVDIPGYCFLDWVTKDYELKYYFDMNDETVIQVLPVFYLNKDDRILSSYFTTNYEWDNYTYLDGVHEVLFGGECLGYVLKK